MYQFFSKPDRYCGRCGDLQCCVTEHRLSHVPPFLRETRALFVSDIHVLSGASDADMAALTRHMAATRPHIILLGGDYSDRAEPARRLFRHLSELSAPLGMFGVPGNNDREAFPDIDDLRRVMADAGFRLLVNEAERIPLNGGTLIVAGIDDYRHGRPDPAGLFPAGRAPDTFRLLLSHYPRAVSPMPDLMLSGHTHGGQFNLLGITPFTIGFERIFAFRRASRYVEGMHEYRGARMLVSKGIGASRIPLRIGVKPEINLIRFD